MLPLHHRDKFLHTETNVCIKAFYMDEPTCPLAGRECFDTLNFYQLRCRHSLLILEAAHIIAVFSVSAGSRSLCHIMKNPGVFSSGVLGRYTNIV